MSSASPSSMMYPSQFSSPTMYGLVLAFLAFLLFYNRYVVRSKGAHSIGKGAPEPDGASPIIGHLRVLARGREPLPRKLGSLADVYGPAFAILMGMNRVLVVSSWELAKECFTNNDKALASRPQSVVTAHMSYNRAMFGFAPYGPYWRAVRKIVVHELLSSQSLDRLKHLQTSEVRLFVKELYELWVSNNRRAVKVDISQNFGDLIFNVLTMIVVGKRFFGGFSMPEDDAEVSRFRQAIIERVELSGFFTLTDLFPFLGWFGMDLLQGHIRAVKRTAKEFDFQISRCLEEHKQKRRSSPGQEPSDFMDKMKSIMEDKDIPMYDPDTIIKATALSPLLAGRNTTSTTLTWAVALLMNHPHILKKAQDELDRHVGKQRLVAEPDIPHLPYLQAIVKETMRLYPAAPLGVPHQAKEDCYVSGFRVPAGTRVLVNLWKLQRDPRVWADPDEFQPERFLRMDVDGQRQHFEYIPFGAGRRSCPGNSLALQIMHLTLAHLLHGFDLKTPLDGPVDMTEINGITLNKATPLEVLLAPRLPWELYTA